MYPSLRAMSRCSSRTAVGTLRPQPPLECLGGWLQGLVKRRQPKWLRSVHLAVWSVDRPRSLARWVEDFPPDWICDQQLGSTPTMVLNNQTFSKDPAMLGRDCPELATPAQI